MHVNEVTNGPYGPVYTVARASAIIGQRSTKLLASAKLLAVTVNEGDL
jgi:hypothetical protein